MYAPSIGEVNTYAGLSSPDTDSTAAAAANQKSCENWEILDGKSIVVNMATRREQ